MINISMNTFIKMWLIDKSVTYTTQLVTIIMMS